MCGLRYSEVTRASSLLNAEVDSKLARLKTGNFYSVSATLHVYRNVESEAKDEVAFIKKEFKFRKRMAPSVLGSLITVPFTSSFGAKGFYVTGRICAHLLVGHSLLAQSVPQPLVVCWVSPCLHGIFFFDVRRVFSS